MGKVEKKKTRNECNDRHEAGKLCRLTSLRTTLRCLSFVSNHVAANNEELRNGMRSLTDGHRRTLHHSGSCVVRHLRSPFLATLPRRARPSLPRVLF